MKYKVSRAPHAVASYYTCMKLPYVIGGQVNAKR